LALRAGRRCASPAGLGDGWPGHAESKAATNTASHSSCWACPPGGTGTVWYAKRPRRWPSALSRRLLTLVLGKHSPLR
jgi:hypothetical protein